MRTSFIQQLTLEARVNPRIFLIVGDLGYSVVEPFAEEFPDRFLNAGVAEQNMTGVAAGLASEGFHVFTYSIANFPTLRCLEQFRNDVCYHNLPVTVVAVGAGLAYGNLGYSHHGVQDIGCLRGMPNITLMSPADPGEATSALRHLVGHPGPSYLRLGKAGEPGLYTSGETCATGPVLVAGVSSASTAIICTGSILREALKAAEQLKDVAVYSLPVVAPLRAGSLDVLARHTHWCTVEEHVRDGGIGELLAGYRPSGISMTLLNVKGDLSHVVGSQQFLRGVHGIDSTGILGALAGR